MPSRRLGLIGTIVRAYEAGVEDARSGRDRWPARKGGRSRDFYLMGYHDAQARMRRARILPQLEMELDGCRTSR